MSKTDTLITIRLQANTASILITEGGIGKIGHVEDYQSPSDLVPVLEKLLTEIKALELPDIQTSAEDKVTFYGGYQNWTPSDMEWGFDEPDYKPPTKAKKSRKEAKSLSKVVKVEWKAPFILNQDGKQRTLQLIDDFDVSLECKDNKNLKFDNQDDAIRIAQVLATQDNLPITVQDKSGKAVETIQPVQEAVLAQA